MCRTRSWPCLADVLALMGAERLRRMVAAWWQTVGAIGVTERTTRDRFAVELVTA